MSAEDALYGVMLPVARKLMDHRRGNGGPVELAAIVERTLQEFSASIALEPHTPALRRRLLAQLAAEDAAS